MKRYEVVKDLQGSGIEGQYTAEGWLECMVGWRDADWSWGEWGDGRDGYKDDRETATKWWRERIKTPEGERGLIDYISEVWGLDIQEVKEKQ